MKKAFIAALAATVLVAAPASAHDVNLSTGVGFVGKGEVQTALGMNNHALQAAADTLSFTIRDRVEYDVFCENTVGGDRNTQTLRNTFDRQRNINSSVAYDPRRANQVNGFNLTGLSGGNTGSNNSVQCPGGWEPDSTKPNGTHIVEVGSSGGGLYVNGVLLP